MDKLILKHIKKSFQEKKVLKDCSMIFEKGKIYGLLGRNGSGKTTLFNCISNEIMVYDGQFLYENNDETYTLKPHQIGYLFSTPMLPSFMTGYEFLKFYIEIHQDKIKNTLSLDEYFDQMEFTQEDRHKLINGYSYGMKNKLQMLCFFITKPDIVLLDEPLTSLDVVIAADVKKMLLNMKHDHILVLSTHILQLALDLCDEIVLLHDGKLELIDASLLKEPNFEDQLIQILKENPNEA